uniref:RNA polymerase beta'' subunit n=1 Tax=Kalinella pachyderma TaxID=2704665 RepID=UPI002411408A|nr:RNA polymerase beta'' subunit [Kalinella pachyderma]WDY12871.1 RNA polymerase beta'' subunit [Kalinella pachyderma]
MNPVWKYNTQHKTFIFFNQSFDKKRLKAFITWILKNSGEEEALKTIEILKEIGFRYATKAGISIGLNDLTTPFLKPSLVSKAQLTMNVTDQDFSGARITVTERSQRIIDTWHRASESLKKQVVDHFSTYDPFNPVYIMALSGARGNFSQVRQLIGMRGLMADQQGKIVNFPIRSNLREGLTLTEYFISCSGARKGLVDTALRTADTGYLTRRLVDVSHHIIVKKVRCNTHRGIAVKALQSYNKTLLTLKERLIGRVLAEDVLQKDKNLRLAKRDQEISPKLALQISLVRQKVYIRSPLTCTFTDSVCQLCYGWSMSQGNLVPLGEAVGVIAAQSIGEPGTQLTMRTFHTGGVFSGDLLQEIRAPYAGKISFSRAFQGLLIRTTQGRIAFLTKTDGEIIVSSSAKRSFAVPFQALTMLFVRQGESVEKNQLLAEFAIVTQEGNQPIKNKQTLFAELSGKVIENRGGTYKAKPCTMQGTNKLKEIVHLPVAHARSATPCPFGARRGMGHGQSKQEKLEEPEDDLFKYIEPTKSGRLGFFRILAMRMGATFSYFHPLTPYYQKRGATISRLCFSPKLRFVYLLLGLPLPLGATSLGTDNDPFQLRFARDGQEGTRRGKKGQEGARRGIASASLAKRSFSAPSCLKGAWHRQGTCTCKSCSIVPSEHTIKLGETKGRHLRLRCPTNKGACVSRLCGGAVPLSPLWLHGGYAPNHQVMGNRAGTCDAPSGQRCLVAAWGLRPQSPSSHKGARLTTVMWLHGAHMEATWCLVARPPSNHQSPITNRHGQSLPCPVAKRPGKACLALVLLQVQPGLCAPRSQSPCVPSYKKYTHPEIFQNNRLALQTIAEQGDLATRRNKSTYKAKIQGTCTFLPITWCLVAAWGLRPQSPSSHKGERGIACKALAPSGQAGAWGMARRHGQGQHKPWPASFGPFRGQNKAKLCNRARQALPVPCFAFQAWSLLGGYTVATWSLVATRPCSDQSPLPRSPLPLLAPSGHGMARTGIGTEVHTTLVAKRSLAQLRVAKRSFSVATWGLRPQSHQSEALLRSRLCQTSFGNQGCVHLGANPRACLMGITVTPFTFAPSCPSPLWLHGGYAPNHQVKGARHGTHRHLMAMPQRCRCVPDGHHKAKPYTFRTFSLASGEIHKENFTDILNTTFEQVAFSLSANNNIDTIGAKPSFALAPSVPHLRGLNLHLGTSKVRGPCFEQNKANVQGKYKYVPFVKKKKTLPLRVRVGDYIARGDKIYTSIGTMPCSFLPCPTPLLAPLAPSAQNNEGDGHGKGASRGVGQGKGARRGKKEQEGAWHITKLCNLCGYAAKGNEFCCGRSFAWCSAKRRSATKLNFFGKPQSKAKLRSCLFAGHKHLKPKSSVRLMATRSTQERGTHGKWGNWHFAATWSLVAKPPSSDQSPLPRRGIAHNPHNPGCQTSFGCGYRLATPSIRRLRRRCKSADAIPIISGTTGKIIKISRTQITFQKVQSVLFYSNANLHVRHNDWVKRGSPILTLTHQTLITGDIVQGIPRIEQLFEAFTSPPHGTKNSNNLHNTLHTQVRDIFRKAWLQNVLPIAVRQSLEEIQQILVESIQKVYLSQGVLIADKHVEIIVRQMTSKVEVLDSGSTGLLLEEVLNLRQIENANLTTPGKKALYVPAIVGLTQAALSSDSFISAASFQETTRVLSRDAVIGKSDFLRGLKEKVVIGDLISAGTGLEIYFAYNFLPNKLNSTTLEQDYKASLC